MASANESRAGYSRMLKSTSTLAGAKVVTILISIVRTKILAILLGPSGFGAVSLVVASTDLARVAFACGLDGATARKVAAAATDPDPRKLDHAYRVSSRTALLIGVLAGIALAVASPFLSASIVGDATKFWLFGFGAISLIFTPRLGIQLAFLQGLRQSSSLAICQIIVSFAGAAINILLVAWLGVIGGIITLLPLAAISLTVHHAFLKRHRPDIETAVRIPATVADSVKLLKLGSGFAVNGIWLAASGWLNLLFISHFYGTAEAVRQIGLYNAASTMSNLYIGILISAMATEFYPGLVQTAHDRPAMNRLLNQQTTLSIAIGVPVTLGVIIFAPWVLYLLYTREFMPGAELMRWMLAGTAIRCASSSLGFTLLATGSPRILVLSELAMGTVTITLAYTLLQIFGLVGIGMASVAANVLYLVGVMWVTHRMGIHWNSHTIRILAETLVVLAVCLGISLVVDAWQATLVSGLLVIGYASHLCVILRKESGIDISQILRKLRSFSPRKNV
jgi:enterobacterial common antigen flippase